MKLNNECFNDLLYFIQQNIEVDGNGLLTSLTVSTIIQKVTKYDRADVYYSLKKLIDAGYISSDETFSNNAHIYDITYKGHLYMQSYFKSPILTF